MAFATINKGMLLALALIVPAVSSCSGYRPAPKAFHEATIQPYRLDSGDRLRITVFEQPGLSNTYTVDQAGYVAFPLIGSVPARGRTLQELEGAIAAKLRQGYLRDPDISIEVDRYRSIYVMGEVNQPRALSFKTATMNLSDVLGSVGGLSQTSSNGNAVYVIRGVENLDVEPAKIYQLEAESPTAMALASHFQVRPQDVVYVGPANVTRWNRFISQLVPSASIVGTGASAAKNWSEYSNNSK